MRAAVALAAAVVLGGAEPPPSEPEHLFQLDGGAHTDWRELGPSRVRPFSLFTYRYASVRSESGFDFQFRGRLHELVFPLIDFGVGWHGDGFGTRLTLEPWLPHTGIGFWGRVAPRHYLTTDFSVGLGLLIPGLHPLYSLGYLYGGAAVRWSVAIDGLIIPVAVRAAADIRVRRGLWIGPSLWVGHPVIFAFLVPAFDVGFYDPGVGVAGIEADYAGSVPFAAATGLRVIWRPSGERVQRLHDPRGEPRWPREVTDAPPFDPAPGFDR